MEKEVKNVLLVIGASSDMGEALIESAHEKYSVIYAHYRNMNEELANLKERIGEKLVLLQADLSDEEQVRGLITEINGYGSMPTHIVHFAAPLFSNQKFQKIQWDVFEQGWDISFKSIVLILQAFLPKMAKAHYGKIVFMLSFVINNMPLKYCSNYVAIKYALLGLLKSLAVEYADKGITVNGISPVMVDTKFIKTQPDFIVEQHAESSPIGRNLVSADVIPSIEWLLSEGADCVNGQNISITCGR